MMSLAIYYVYIGFKKENANVLNILSGNKPTVTSKTFLEQKE